MNIVNKSWAYILGHKVISVIGLIVVIGVGIWIYKDVQTADQPTTYVLGAVNRDTVVSTVTGTGQVSVSDQINLTTKASGNIILKIAQGQEVKAGDEIAEVYDPNAYASVQSSKLALAKLTEAPTTLTLTQQQDAITNAQASLASAYDNSYTNTITTFNDLAGVITGLNDIFYNKTTSPYFSDVEIQSQPYGIQAIAYKYTAGAEVDEVTRDYQTLRTQFEAAQGTATSSAEAVLSAQTEALAQSALQATKDTATAVNYIVENTPENQRTTQMTNNENSLTGWVSSLDGDTSSLQNAITDITSDQNNLTEAQETLASTQAGPDVLDVQSDELALQQQENTYDEDYIITAPFDGTVAQIDVNNNDPVNSGVTVGTIVSNQQVADLSLNEIDVAKVKVGDKATLTFDAAPNLTIAGTISDIEAIGTVTQGVASYAVKVNFDTPAPQIEPGMSVTATIITDIEQNALVVPSSAIKTSGSVSYVQVFNTASGSSSTSTQITTSQKPVNQQIQTGISNGTETEILSGLTEGQQIVVRTLATSTKSTASSTAAPSIFGSTGAGARAAGSAGGFGGGGAARPAGGG